jgi:hypothetical protein
MAHSCQLDYTGFFLENPKIKLGSLVAPLGRCTQSEGETLELLLTTNFPNLEITEEMAAPAAAHHAGSSDWWVAVRIVNYRTVEWAIDSLAPYRSQGLDGMFPALLQEGQRVVVPNLVRIFCACLVTGYILATWHQVNVVVVGT